MSKQDLALFLRHRRQAQRPGGGADTRVRRTPGLRREEVAERAHMSVDYYVRLEQARGPHPSPRILESLSGALRLDEAERRHLYRLADTLPAAPPGPSTTVSPQVAGMLERMPDTAAVVTNAAYDVVAHNALAARLMGHLGTEQNLARHRFLDNARWSSASEEFAEIAVARLQAAVARYPHDAALHDLIAELRTGSEEFDGLWRSSPVRVARHRTKIVEHADVGRLRLNCDVLTVPDDDQQVVFITADPGTREARALKQLQRAG